jgi:hypothetical protein
VGFSLMGSVCCSKDHVVVGRLDWYGLFYGMDGEAGVFIHG